VIKGEISEKYVADTTERKHTCKILLMKFERKRPLERPRHRYEDTVRMDPKI
jgi:hypothetical protein